STLPKDPRIGPVLFEAMKTSDDDVMHAARAALLKLPHPPPQCVQFMVDRFVEHPVGWRDPDSRYAPRDFLLRVGPDATLALSGLSSHPNSAVRLAAMKLLGEIAWKNPPGDTFALKRFEHDPAPEISREVRARIEALDMRFGRTRSASA